MRIVTKDAKWLLSRSAAFVDYLHFAGEPRARSDRVGLFGRTSASGPTATGAARLIERLLWAVLDDQDGPTPVNLAAVQVSALSPQ